MRILLLSDTYSEHTEKWARGLADKGIEVGLFSFNKASYPWYIHPNIKLFFEPKEKIDGDDIFTKLSYLKYVFHLRKIISQFKPHILHAHYATSYGLLGALSFFHPFVLSVWGSDVFDFPKRSWLHKQIFQFNLRKANAIMSTSEVMKSELNKYTKKNIYVTPFGVDTNVFKKTEIATKHANTLYIGTIKPIEEIYGITYIIEAAEILVNRFPNKNFKFLLIGPGILDYYKELILRKNLQSYFEVTGRVPFLEVANYFNLLDIFLNVSIVPESFGVSVVEAMACEKPVIVTDVGGLMEVVKNGEFGIVIPKKDSIALANAIEKVMNDADFYSKLGTKARNHVLKNYDWKNNLQAMIDYYNLILEK